jgi:hypothetical protein
MQAGIGWQGAMEDLTPTLIQTLVAHKQSSFAEVEYEP